MTKRHGTIVTFTGADVPIHRKTLIRMGAKACKVSFYGISQRKTDLDELADDLRKFDYVIFEPGMGAIRSRNKKAGTGMDAGKFIDAYYDCGERLAGKIDVMLAYDLMSEDFSWSDIADAVHDGNDRGLPVIPTVYAFQPLDSLERSGYLDYDTVNFIMNEKHRYNGQSLMMKLMDEEIRIHGHACNTMVDYISFPWYSADTAAWLDGQRYGTTYQYVSGRIVPFNARDKVEARRKLMVNADRYGLDLDLLDADIMGSTDEDVVAEVNALNLVAWMEFAESRLADTSKVYWK